MINILINIVGINKHIVGDDGSLKKKKDICTFCLQDLLNVYRL